MKQIAVALLLGISFFAMPSLSPAADKKEKTITRELYQDLELFAKILHHVKSDYVEDVKDKELIEGSIRGMLTALDPHSLFMPAEVYRELRVDTEGKFGGIGIEVTSKDNFLTVVAPLEGTPADRARIRAGDRILRINKTPAKGMSLTDAVKMMRGERGSRITLVLQREGSKPFQVTLVRDLIRIQSVRKELVDKRYGYVRVTSFQEGTAKELDRALRELEKKVPGGLAGLVLDLRNNPGGLLDEAVEVADQFLESGTIVVTKSRHNKEVDKKEARREKTHPAYPLIVMVNGGSASAAEIVAGALQDHRRGILLGTSTFGKGSVQTVYELGDGSALKLTIAKYYTPSGRSIQAQGIKPDIEVGEVKPEMIASTATTPRERVVREKDLKGHLEGGSPKGEEEDSEKEAETSPKGGSPKGGSPKGKKGKATPEQKPEDYQKETALNYIKSWDTFQSKGRLR
ncbi:MAG: S41 family peptidase [Deltaproteobacteria bacterium]|nr:S41 family peptidase [Deltaproteobacteria bacterium]